MSRSILRDAGAKVEPNVGSTVPMCSHTLLPQILTPTPTSCRYYVPPSCLHGEKAAVCVFGPGS